MFAYYYINIIKNNNEINTLIYIVIAIYSMIGQFIDIVLFVNLHRNLGLLDNNI